MRCFLAFWAKHWHQSRRGKNKLLLFWASWDAPFVTIMMGFGYVPVSTQHNQSFLQGWAFHHAQSPTVSGCGPRHSLTTRAQVSLLKCVPRLGPIHLVIGVERPTSLCHSGQPWCIFLLGTHQGHGSSVPPQGAKRKGPIQLPCFTFHLF